MERPSSGPVPNSRSSTSVDHWLDGWVASLADYVPTTRTAYVGDVAVFATLLVEARSRRIPSSLTDQTILRRQGGASASQHQRVHDAKLYQLAERFSIRSQSLVRCGEALNALTLEDLTPDDVTTAVQRLRNTSGAARAQRIVSSFGSLLRYLVSQGALVASPLITPATHLEKVARQQSEPPDQYELAALYATCCEFDHGGYRPWPARDFATVKFLITTGLREDEFIDLRARAFVEDESGAHVVVTSRSGERRVVPIPDDTLDAVRDYLAERESLLGPVLDDDHLFVRTNGLPYDARSLYRMTSRLFRRAGVPPRPGSMVHLLRSTFVQNVRNAGLGAVELQQLLGHETIVSTKRLLAAGVNSPRTAAVSVRIGSREAGM